MATRGKYAWNLQHYGKACQQPIVTIHVASNVRVQIHSKTVQAWAAWAATLQAFKYPLRQRDTGAYNCRPVTGGTTPSSHAYGLSVDANWTTNPYIKTPTLRKVKWGVDTDMPASMVAAVKAIRTKNGAPVFLWGGDWRTIKDTMHYQIVATPAELATGIVSKYGFFQVNKGTEDVVQRGDKGLSVGAAQTAINKAGYSPQLKVDSDYGPATAAGVAWFQKQWGLTVNGDVVDGMTAARVDSILYPPAKTVLPDKVNAIIDFV